MTTPPPTDATSPPLWQLLDAVAAALLQVRRGQSATTVLAQVAPRLRPGVQALLYQVLRELGRAEALRQRLVPRTPAPRVDALLCSALALLWQPQQAPYDSFTLVNQAVEAAKRQGRAGQPALVNACLRRFLRERESLVAATDADPQARWNHPRWWIERLQADYPGSWQQILQANNAHAPMTLRIHKQKSTLRYVLKAFDAINLVAKHVGEDGVQLREAVPVQRLPGFAQGHVSVQDAAAQLAAPLLLQGLDLSRPQRVLDACAAPGGKTAHLLEWAGAAPLHVTALEIDAERSRRIHETLERVGVQAQVLVADAARPQDWWAAHCQQQPFDAILLDAPCSASGIVRRHPDVRWLRRPTDIAQLAALQKQLLERLWPLLRPGGRLLYCTCSVFRAEGEQQIETFLARHNDAALLPSPGHLIPHSGAWDAAVPDNGLGDHDGFFYALLHKAAA